ncbi:MAG: Bug family tripartite tricarboxylate transporter substrate binding protein [Burkholderiales bacterium]
MVKLEARAYMSTAALFCGMVFSSLANTQSYPAKPVRLVTQFSPGSSGDTLIRTFAQPFSEQLGQPVIVENQAGASGILAAQQVARAAPDGYSLLAGTSATQVIRRFMAKSMPFDPAKDFTPISQLIESVTVIVAAPSLPVNSLRELLDYAKANPGKIAYGTSGVGSEHHLSGEQIAQLSGVQMVHVPYKASLQALLDTAADRLPMAFTILSVAMPQVKAGKVRYIAVVGDKRSRRLPDVPALAEGVPGFEPPPSWTGVFGPANLPPAILARISADTIKAMTLPDTRQKLDAQSLDVVASTPEAFAALIRRQTELVGKIVKAAGIQPSE